MNVDKFHPLPFLPTNIHPVTETRDFTPFMEGCVLLKPDTKAVRNGAMPMRRFCGTLPIVGEPKQLAVEVAQTKPETKEQKAGAAETSQKVAPVKRTKCQTTKKQQTLPKEQRAEAAEVPANVPPVKRTSKRKAATKPEPLTKEQRVDVTQVLAKQLPAKRPRRKSNAKAETLAKEPTTELSVKALLAKVLNSKYSAKPEVAVVAKKPQVEVAEVSVKALLAKLTTKRKSSNKAEAQKQTRQPVKKVAQKAAALPSCPCCPPALQQVDTTRTLFVQKYQQLEKLGEGGFGSVYAGYRKSDCFPVAIKYIPIEKVESVFLNIMKQLVDAAIKMHAVNVFHRDLKQRNILLEATFSLPRVRLIDFGCSCFVNEEPYHEYAGTLRYAPPEYVLKRPYKAGPATVWQLGALLFELLDGTERFDTFMFLIKGLTLNRVLSQGKSRFHLDVTHTSGTNGGLVPSLSLWKWLLHCKDFLWICLTSDTDQRATLEQMQWHPWLL
ncbi:probable serine/threonine-protein kinase MARK-A [Phyllopteryx taeniolatus]|uniref:probable serine/threonine-protein kinase MARK-A n=1 Tax=Phyllopteryx taeniolatus TaxID=161469 RepID=UPI002AD1EB66|nr:probable serine/threonine-protein kinase MARK-A [Phyllopteryx taeniolatus]